MKTCKMLSVFALVVLGWMTSFGQAAEPEVPGDNFSLEGALELFKQSSSPEDFEKLLNSPNSKVNNLDLNGDGYIDYIRVHDRYEGNVHAFVIQAVVSERELQDVAVITLEKLANGKAVLQIIGDEDIYGIETIIEPTQEVRTYAGTQTNRTVVNVWAWPSVQYVYSPYYVGWASPWGWYRRPIWWHAWRPVTYVHYYPIWRPYYRHYSVCYTPRVVYARSLYRPHRSTSIIVHDRHYAQVDRYRSNYRDTNRRPDPGRTNGRSSYANDDQRVREGAQPERRAESDRTRRNEVVEQTSDSHSSPSRQRAVPAQRTFNRETDNENSGARRRTVPSNIERRSEAATPPDFTESRRPVLTTPSDATRSRSSRPEAEQRTVTRQQSIATDVQRTPAQMRRAEPPTPRTEAPSRRAETRQPDVRPARSAPSHSSQERAAPQRSNSQPSSSRSGDARRGRQ